MSGSNWHPVESLNGACWHVLPLVFADAVPASVVDFGCNAAEWLECALSLGVRDVLGIDGDNMRGHLRIQEDCFSVLDLARPVDLGRRYELAICLEVAEHVPTECSDTLVDSVTKHADLVLWSAAVPGQGGFGHINCQPPEFWREKFLARGYNEDRSLCEAISKLPIPSYYANNITMYRMAL